MKQYLLKYPLARRFIYPIRPSPEDVREFWDYMTTRHNIKVINKADSYEMQMVGQVLDRMGIVEKNKFLKNYTTTVPMRPVRGIYVPFEIGVATEVDLWEQMVVCTHEINHVIQAERGNGRVTGLTFSWDYLSNSAARAHYEAGGYRCNMEMYWMFQGRMLDPAALAYKLINYNCSMLDCETVEKELLMCIPAIKKGAIVELATREAAAWINEKYGRAA